MKKKIIVIGLGNFGGNLAIKLTEDGHEVFGVDKSPSKVDNLQRKINHAIGLDTSEESSINHLPLDDTDIVVIAIGENVGASITTTALIKKHFTGRILARSLTPVHKTVLEAMQIEEIIEPEAEYAHELSNRLMVKGAVKSMELHGDYEIVEVKIPRKIVGLTLGDLDIKKKFNAHIVTVIKQSEKKNFLGSASMEQKVHGILHSIYQFEANDLLIVFGTKVNIDKFIEENI
ncbi:MAG: TrkA family potassium uptake protein [Saprospiraceae bacterium]|nr:TrkA family potassium uptake protein [Saprospiraceae bacterium]